MDVKVSMMQPCMCCIENHEWNTQGGVRVTLTSTGLQTSEKVQLMSPRPQSPGAATTTPRSRISG